MPVPRLCVIGCGSWANRMHLPALKRVTAAGDAVVAGVCDVKGEAAEAFAAQVGGCPAYTSIEEVLDAQHPDGAVILVPPQVSADVASFVTRRKVPFLIEKPPAPDAKVHRRLIKATRELTHIVAYNRRYAPYVMKAREWIGSESPQAVVGQFARYRRREQDFTTTAVHAVDTVTYLAGGALERVEIEVVPANGIFNFFLCGETVSGTHVNVTITPDTASAFEHYAVQGVKRSAVIAFPFPSVMDLPGYVELHEENKVVRRLLPRDFGIDDGDLPELAGIGGEHRTFIAALKENRPVASTLSATLQTQQIRDILGALVAKGGGCKTVRLSPLPVTS